MTATGANRWPSIPVAEWLATRDTLQLYTQVVGKVRLANEPLINHWWNVPAVRVGPRTHDIADAAPDWPGVPDRLRLRRSSPRRRHRRRCHAASLDLGPRTVADFYAAVMAHARRPRRRHRDLADARRDPRRHPVPRRPGPRQLRPRRGRTASGSRSSRWNGSSRCSAPGSSARPARCTCSGEPSTSPTPASRAEPRPPHPGGAPNCGPHVMWEAYSHEVSSCGYWPGPPGEEGVFYAYAYPDPPGYRDTPVAAGRRPLGRRARRVRPALRARAHRDGPRRRAARVPAVHLRGGRQQRGLGPGRARTSELPAVGSVRGGYVEPWASFGRRPGSRGRP